MTNYIAKTTFSTANEDNWEDGEIGNNIWKDYQMEFESDNKNDILEKISNYHDVKIENLELNSCEENGRVDVCFYENADGCSPTNRELELFKENKLNLFSVRVSYQLYKIDTVSAI